MKLRKLWAKTGCVLGPLRFTTSVAHNFFNFLNFFFGNFCKIICWHPVAGWRPSNEESQIRCIYFIYVKKVKGTNLEYYLKTFQTTFYSLLQLIILVNNEQKVALKVFKRVRHLWVLKFHKNNTFSDIASNGTIFDKFQPICV